MIMRIAYRAARAGILTGVLLAFARISGETAPLLFTALNNQFFSTNMNAPMPACRWSSSSSRCRPTRTGRGLPGPARC